MPDPLDPGQEQPESGALSDPARAADSAGSAAEATADRRPPVDETDPLLRGGVAAKPKGGKDDEIKNSVPNIR